jgi:hypothetical protein
MSGPIADLVRAQLDASLLKLDHLLRYGRQIGDALAEDPAALPSLAAARIWQQDCAETISQLSGGSKAHWLSRAYSAALLVRSTAGDAVVEATVSEIIERVLAVLEQAVASLSQPDTVAAASTSVPPVTRRFDFVRHAPLRPILEQAFLDSGRALEQGDYALSVRTSCGILEAIITDALEHTRAVAVAEWSFEQRIAAAVESGLIRGGCARLPAVAREYRSVGASIADVSERDAKVARQVLHVVMRDLDPGR